MFSMKMMYILRETMSTATIEKTEYRTTNRLKPTDSINEKAVCRASELHRSLEAYVTPASHSFH